MYVLLTPARNEVEFIEQTIESVLSQTLLPNRWVIISDGSNDGTDDIIGKYEEQYEFIFLLRANHKDKRSFGSKALAIKAGIKLLAGVKYDYIGIMDADITVEPEYYQKVIFHLEKEEKLGITGGIIYEFIADKFIRQKNDINSVAGAVQMFNRRCYEEVGGYRNLVKGGIDAVAEVMARMKGWKVHSIDGLIAYHHRPVGASKNSILQSKFRYGQREYFIGTIYLYWLIKCVVRIKEYPFFLGSTLMFVGYLFSFIFQRNKKPLSRDFYIYTKNEQKKKLLNKLNLN